MDWMLWDVTSFLFLCLPAIAVALVARVCFRVDARKIIIFACLMEVAPIATGSLTLPVIDLFVDDAATAWSLYIIVPAVLGVIAARLWLHIDSYKVLFFGSLLNTAIYALFLMILGPIAEDVFARIQPGPL